MCITFQMPLVYVHIFRFAKINKWKQYMHIYVQMYVYAYTTFNVHIETNMIGYMILYEII